MAETMPANDTAPEGTAAEAAPKRSLFSKLKVIVFVVVVIVAECSLAYLYIPTATDTAVMAGANLPEEPKAEAAGDKKDKEKGKGGEAEASDEVEVDLGQFSLTAFQPTSNTALRIDFHLYGTVGAKDDKEFLKLKEENQHRFRDQVIVTFRSADINDLTDAGLGLMKRKILEKANHMLGKPLLHTVIFSDYSFIEQ
jgi:hypothetical protein